MWLFRRTSRCHVENRPTITCTLRAPIDWTPQENKQNLCADSTQNTIKLENSPSSCRLHLHTFIWTSQPQCKSYNVNCPLFCNPQDRSSNSPQANIQLVCFFASLLFGSFCSFFVSSYSKIGSTPVCTNPHRHAISQQRWTICLTNKNQLIDFFFLPPSSQSLSPDLQFWGSVGTRY